MPLNDESCLSISALTPDPFTIQLPESLDGDAISVIYRAYPELVTSYLGKIEIPLTLLDALLLYVAYKAYLTVRAKGNDEHMSYLTLFEQSCKQAEQYGVLTADNSTNYKMFLRGFA
jgi:hypothetical protein